VLASVRDAVVALDLPIRSLCAWMSGWPRSITLRPCRAAIARLSQQIREIFAEHTLIIEPLSLDEAYLDVTENLQNIPLARDIALAMQRA